ncbi:cold shock domain-containing protein [Acinetobacter haemolyticus]|uniref:cold shock domain-containing protein n=1 Tax=Acinetobacter haemolyticus TaxID=29430 RepID=UPI0003062CDD|nr:cold shock domain-containing protein [Acinetobacter haemolyticus]
MFLTGKIKNYNSDRGFGFIAVEHDRSDIFFHITDFPKIGGEPKTGELVKFLIVEDKGKFKATNIVRLDLKAVSPVHEAIQPDMSIKNIAQSNSKIKGKKGLTYTIVAMIIIAILLGLVFKKYQAYQQSQQLKVGQLIEEQKRIIDAQRQAIGDLPDVKLSEKTENALKSTHNSGVSIQQQVASENQFSCDGRTHCSQMRSYDEAVFFLRNCPNTQMDGDGDGIPCERQFARH